MRMTETATNVALRTAEQVGADAECAAIQTLHCAASVSVEW